MKDLRPLEEMFPELLSSNKWLGFSIDDGWRELAIDAIQSIKANLSPADLKIFRLIQVKEKFGNLRIYYEASGITHVDLFRPDGNTHLEIPDTNIEQDHKRLSEEGNTIIRSIIEHAENRAARTCETCGSAGRLYGGDYVQTLCDDHAKEKDKIFPKAYGEMLDCRPHKQKFPDQFGEEPVREREAACEHRLYFKNTVADVWYWVGDKKRELWFFIEDVPEHLVNAFFDYKDAHKEKHYLPYSAPDDDSIQTLCADDFLSTLGKVRKQDGSTSILEPFFTLPAGVKVDPRTQLERDIAEIHDLDVSIKFLVPAVSLGGIAVGTMTASQLPQLFRISDSAMGPEMIDTPIHFLRSELGQIEKMKTKLEAALKVFDDKK